MAVRLINWFSHPEVEGGGDAGDGWKMPLSSVSGTLRVPRGTRWMGGFRLLVMLAAALSSAGAANLLEDPSCNTNAGDWEGTGADMSSVWYVRYGPNGGGTVLFAKRFSVTNDSSMIGGSGAPHFEVTSGADSAEKGIPQDITERLAFHGAVKKSTTFSYNVKVKNLGVSSNSFFIAFRAKLMGTGTADGSTISVNSAATQVTPGGWQTVSGTFTVNWSNFAEYAEGLCWARVHLAQSGNMGFQFDDFVLEEIAHDDSTDFPPEAQAVVLPGSGGNTVRFHAGRSRDRDGAIVRYDWDFGDGTGWQTDLGPQPSITYGAEGAYSARLRITDDDGLTGETAFAVVVPFLPRPADYDGYARTLGSLQSNSAGGNLATRGLEWAAGRGYPQSSQGVTEDGRVPASDLAGDEADLNGRLLYPDGQPRFRLMVCNGGTTRAMINNFTSRRAANNALEFFRNGGGWVGTCAGTDILTMGFTKPLASFKSGGGRAEHENIIGYVPIPVNYWGVGARSQGAIKAYLNNGGGSETGPRALAPTHFLMDHAAWAGTTLQPDSNGLHFPKGLFRESSFIYKAIPGSGTAHPAGNNPDIEYSMYFDPATATDPSYYDTAGGSIPMDDAWAGFAYVDPANPTAGRAAGAFFHTEGATAGGTASSGSPRLLQPGASWYPFLFREMDYVDLRTQEVPLQLKSCLANGVAVIADSATTMVGDKQYHYYAFNVPQGAVNLAITLDGLIQNCDLYVKKAGWPIAGSNDFSSAATGSTTAETIRIPQPEPGVYVIAVHGNHAVANGTPYTISASWEGLVVHFEDSFSYDAPADGRVSLHNPSWTDAATNRYALRGTGSGSPVPVNSLFTDGTASGSGIDLRYLAPSGPLPAGKTCYVGFNINISGAPDSPQDFFRILADNAGADVTRARISVTDNGGATLAIGIGTSTEPKVSTASTFQKGTLYRIVVSLDSDSTTPSKVWVGSPGTLAYASPSALATGTNTNPPKGFAFYYAQDLAFCVDNVVFANDWNAAAREPEGHESWEGWRTGAFSLADQGNPSVSGPEADPDGDGLSNLLEYALAAEPTLPDADGLLSPGITEDSSLSYLTLTARLRSDLGALQITPQASADLATWNEPQPVLFSSTDHGDGTRTIVFRDSSPLGGAARRFLRLKVGD